MDSASKFNNRVKPESAYDIKTKCGDILISFKTFKFEFACTLCDEGCTYLSFYELYDHVTKEHNFYSEKGDPAIKLIGNYGTEIEDPLAEKMSDLDEEEYEIEIEYEDGGEGDVNLNLSPIETDEPPDEFDSATDVSTKDETFTESWDNSLHQCSTKECKEEDPTRRRRIIKLIEMYRKCLGLWHTKTANRTSVTLKTAARRLLTQKYDTSLPVHKMRVLLLRMTNCFNKEWKSNSRSNSRPWYFNNMSFLRLADVDVIPDEEFDDFQCPFCANDEMNHSGSMELWKHITEYHKSLAHLVKSESTSYIMLWPTEDILQFIRIYREQESLWNNKSPEYYNRPHKVKAYETIIEKFNKIRPNALKKRESVVESIRILRVFFRRVDKKYQVNNLLEKPETTEEVENYKVYEELLFLKDVLINKQAHFTETYTCDVCERTFKNKSIIIEHYKMQHKDSPFKCSVCPIAFGSEEKLKSHQSTHEEGDGKAYTCPICNMSYSNSNDLDTHLSDHLPKRSDVHICEICGSKIKDRGNLLIHLRRHCDIKNYVCGICQKRFVTSTDRRLHLITHSKEKPYICSFCGIGFKYRHHLTHHNLIHIEPRFKCKQCGLKCLTKIYLIEHEKSHAYPDVPLEKIICEICRKLFSNTRYLQRHKRKVHNLKKRNVCDKVKLKNPALQKVLNKV